MALLSKIQHPNIISLLGYSIHGETRLLVYELMQNGSLETQLHGIFVVFVLDYTNSSAVFESRIFVGEFMDGKENAKEK